MFDNKKASHTITNMGRYFRNTITLIKRSPFTFIAINHIVIFLALIPIAILYILNSRYVYEFGGSGIPLNGLLVNTGGLISHSEIPLMITYSVVYSIIKRFIHSFYFSGYYNYLNSVNSKQHPYKIFFRGGFKKFLHVFSVNIIKYIIVTLVIILLTQVMFKIATPFVVSNFGSSTLVMTISYIIYRLIEISILAFFAFMINEATLTDTSVFKTIIMSIRKIRKIYFLFLGIIIFQILVGTLLKASGINIYVLIILDLYIVQIFNTFIDYPLYMHSSDLVGEHISSYQEV